MTALPTPEEWHRLSPRLDELLDLDRAQREEHLARLAEQDPSIAAQLRALLATATTGADAFLAGQADVGALDLPVSMVGVRVGAYTLDAPLGQGGGGSVWRARRSDGRLEQRVAVKLLHLSLMSQAASERFRREGGILARLSHPNIGGLLDAGVTPTGQPYLVLELVEGEPIDAYCRRLQLDVEARLRLFLDVLAAVGHAHQHLVVHRDLKPGNMLVTAAGQVKLLDFGIAKLLEGGDDPAQSTALTRDGGPVLTPAYAAPEQFEGGEITTATDVYALGVLLFLLLSERHPTLPGGSATGPVAAMHAALTNEPSRLSRAALRGPAAGPSPGHSALRKLGHRLTGDLDNIVARMLRKTPVDRYPTVAAVADDIRRHLAHEPVMARPDTWHYRTGKFIRRHRLSMAAACLATVAVLGGIIGTISQARRAEQQSALAQLERDRALRELGHAEAANEFIGNVLTEGSRRTQSSVGLLDQASALLEDQFDSSPTLRARMQLMLATMYTEMREEGKASSMLASAAGLADRTPATLTVAERCHIDCLRSALAQDLPAVNRALQRLDAAADAPSDVRHVRAVCLTRRSVLHRRLGSLVDAEADARQALGLLDLQAPGRQLAVIHARRELASAIGNQGANAEAAQEWRTLLAHLAAHGRANSVYAAAAHNNLFVRLSTAGQELAAYEQQLRAIAIWTRLQGEDQLDPHLWANLATSLDLLGRSDEAIATIEKALARLRPDTPEAAARSTLVRGALLTCRAHRLRECRELRQRFEAGLPADLPADHFDRALRAYVQAAALSATGDLAGERAALREAVRIARASTVRGGLLPGALIRLAEAELTSGDPAASLAAARDAEAAAATLSRGFRHNSLVGRALLMRGRAELAQGDPDAAARSLSAALEHLRATTGDDSRLTAEAERRLADMPR